MTGAARAASAVVGLAAFLSACGSSRSASPAPHELTLAEARAFDEFPLVYAGAEVEGLPLVATRERDDRARYVSFVYGDCVPLPEEGGCAPPAEIQTWPSRLRGPSSYETLVAGAPEPMKIRVRGMPALSFDAGTRLELTVGSSTVVVFGDSRGRVLDIVRALRCVTQPESVPAPSPDEPLAC